MSQFWVKIRNRDDKYLVTRLTKVFWGILIQPKYFFIILIRQKICVSYFSKVQRENFKFGF